MIKLADARAFIAALRISNGNKLAAALAKREERRVKFENSFFAKLFRQKYADSFGDGFATSLLQLRGKDIEEMQGFIEYAYNNGYTSIRFSDLGKQFEDYNAQCIRWLSTKGK